MVSTLCCGTIEALAEHRKAGYSPCTSCSKMVNMSPSMSSHHLSLARWACMVSPLAALLPATLLLGSNLTSCLSIVHSKVYSRLPTGLVEVLYSGSSKFSLLVGGRTTDYKTSKLPKLAIKFVQLTRTIELSKKFPQLSQV